MKERKGRLRESGLNHRSKFTKVRGGWTKDKIKKQLKEIGGNDSSLFFHKEIAKFDNPYDFKNNLFYHGSGGGIGSLKPSVVLKYVSFSGGGYDEKYWGVSLSKSRNMASNFTGQSKHGYVAPVILKRGSVVKKITEMLDAVEIEDIIEELWDQGIDAVIIGDHSKDTSEQEIVILNPKCIVVGESDYFPVLDKPKMPSFSDKQIEKLWVDSSKQYVIESEKSQVRQKEIFLAKYGRESKREISILPEGKELILYHEENVEEYLKNKQPKIVSTLEEEGASKEIVTEEKHKL